MCSVLLASKKLLTVLSQLMLQNILPIPILDFGFSPAFANAAHAADGIAAHAAPTCTLANQEACCRSSKRCVHNFIY